MAARSAGGHAAARAARFSPDGRWPAKGPRWRHRESLLARPSLLHLTPNRRKSSSAELAHPADF
eukprot:1607756-Alexandrium_andersonii.AAC.1